VWRLWDADVAMLTCEHVRNSKVSNYRRTKAAPCATGSAATGERRQTIGRIGSRRRETEDDRKQTTREEIGETQTTRETTGRRRQQTDDADDDRRKQTIRSEGVRVGLEECGGREGQQRRRQQVVEDVECSRGEMEGGEGRRERGEEERERVEGWYGVDQETQRAILEGPMGLEV
jgi:hypothetical protein